MAIRQPDRLDAWILGSGIASLTAAVHLIREAQVPPHRVHILETLDVAGGNSVSYGDAEHGYDYRGPVRLPFNDGCMDELLSLVPSSVHPGQTVRDDILQFAATRSQKKKGKPPQTRFLAKKSYGVARVEAKKVTLGIRDRIDLFMLASKTEKALGRTKIQEYFHESFFQGSYWFGFKPTHSAAEFRRFVQRFNDLHELQQLNPIDSGQFNMHQSVILPITQFLESMGVDFRLRTTVTDILFSNNPSLQVKSHESNRDGKKEKDKDKEKGKEKEKEKEDQPRRVTAIKTEYAQDPQRPPSQRQEQTIELHDEDIVIVSLGSISSSILPGANARAPPCLDRIQSNLTLDPAGDTTIEAELDENWLLWLELATKHRKFGNAYNFCTRLFDSRVECFTITLSTDDFFTRLTQLTGDSPSPSTLVTLRDSSWLISLRLPLQPVFPGQPASVQVCWGYALYPEKEGNYIKKAMLACSGQEILSEILHHLHFPLDPILTKSRTIPYVMPRAAATLLPRTAEDRPKVVPPGMENLALIGSFVDIPDEVGVTMDYSVRGAQMAVRGLMGVERALKRSKRVSAINLLGLL